MMKNADYREYSLTVLPIVATVFLLIVFFALQDEPRGASGVRVEPVGKADSGGVNNVAKSAHAEERRGCGSYASSPFGSGVDCTEVGANTDVDAEAVTGADDLAEPASTAEYIARQTLMTNKALAGDAGAFGWYINHYTSRCNQLEPEQLAAIPECDPALRSSVDAQFVQVVSRLAAANNTEAQVALGWWYLALAVTKYATGSDANAAIASPQNGSPVQAAVADTGLPPVQISNDRKYQYPEYKAAAEWFARASSQSSVAADFLAFTNSLPHD